MKIKYNNTTYAIPKPFDQCFMGDNPTKTLTIMNPYSNDSAVLPAFAVAIYDTIRGAERTEDYDIVRKGLDWFKKNFAREYMVLLD
jgi:hypothetical protein